MASSLPFPFNVLFEAWRHAKQSAVFAERRWVHAVQQTTIDPKEEFERRSELFAAREAAHMVFKRAMSVAMFSNHSAGSQFSLGQQRDRLDDLAAND